tara:strand:- start:383 stop:700 length:318 start_codon:yes stop_codon:yes gene_type:complete
MPRYASNKRAYGISDRSGFRYRLKDMRMEWNGSLVGKDEFEAKHPQLEPSRIIADPQALRTPRPDTAIEPTAFVVYTNYGDGIIGFKMDTFEATTSLGSVTVTTS